MTRDEILAKKCDEKYEDLIKVNSATCWVVDTNRIEIKEYAVMGYGRTCVGITTSTSSVSNKVTESKVYEYLFTVISLEEETFGLESFVSYDKIFLNKKFALIQLLNSMIANLTYESNSDKLSILTKIGHSKLNVLDELREIDDFDKEGFDTYFYEKLNIIETV